MTVNPLVWAFVGVAVLTIMDALVKALSASFPTFQIVFLRFAFMGAWVGLLLIATRPGWPRRDRLRAHLGRAVMMVITTSSFFYALGHLPLAEVFAISFTAPIFMAIFGAIFLKEKLRLSIAGAIALGFVGMLVTVLGGADGTLTLRGEPFALACAFTAPVAYALGIVLLRSQTAHEHITLIVFVQALLVALLLVPLQALGFKALTATDWLLFAVIGLFGAVGYLAFAAALAKISVARFSIADYTGLIWAAVLGYVFFDEVPRATVWLGAALIIAGCLIVLRAKEAAKAKPA